MHNAHSLKFNIFLLVVLKFAMYMWCMISFLFEPLVADTVHGDNYAIGVVKCYELLVCLWAIVFGFFFANDSIPIHNEQWPLFKHK